MMTVNISNLYRLLFILTIFVPSLGNFELTFFVWVLIAVFTIKKKYSIYFLKYSCYFFAVLVLAVFVGFFFNYKTYFIIRDITYIVKPILGLFIGYQLFINNKENPFKTIVYAGLFVAIIHLILVFYGIILKGANNMAAIREHGGYFNDYEVYILVLLIFNKKFNINFTDKQIKLYITIIAISSFFYLARINFIQFVILFFGMKEWFRLTKRSLIVCLSLISLTLISYSAIYSYNPKRNGQGLDEFLYKIKNIPSEAFSTKINRDDWKKFNDNYRSYENIRTIEQLSNHNTLFFGEGIGSQVDLKQEIHFGDIHLRYISILHNGFTTVFLKTGLLGFCIIFASILFFFKKKNSVNEIDKNINLLLLSTGVFLIFSYWVFLGFYNLLDSKVILIGYLFAIKNSIQTQNIKIAK